MKENATLFKFLHVTMKKKKMMIIWSWYSYHIWIYRDVFWDQQFKCDVKVGGYIPETNK